MAERYNVRIFDAGKNNIVDIPNAILCDNLHINLGKQYQGIPLCGYNKFIDGLLSRIRNKI